MLLATNINLKTFVRGHSDPNRKLPGCANFSYHYDGCSLAKVGKVRTNFKCLVLQGKRCNYFEACVLPTAGETGSATSIFAEYDRIRGISMLNPMKQQVSKTTKVIIPSGKTCECGGEVTGKGKRCEDCTKRRYLQKQREYHKKRYLAKKNGAQNERV